MTLPRGFGRNDVTIPGGVPANLPAAMPTAPPRTGDPVVDAAITQTVNAASTPGTPGAQAQLAQFKIQEAVTGRSLIGQQPPLQQQQRDVYVRELTNQATNPSAPGGAAITAALNTIGASGPGEGAATRDLVAQSINSNVNARVTNADQLARLVDPTGGSFAGGTQMLNQVRDPATLTRTSELLVQRAESFGPQRYTTVGFQADGRGVPAITAAADVAGMAARHGSPAMVAPVLNEIAGARDTGGGTPLAQWITSATTGGNAAGNTGGAVLTRLLAASQASATVNPAIARSADQVFADMGSFDRQAPDGWALTDVDRTGLGAYFTANAGRIGATQPAAAAAALFSLDTPVSRFESAHAAVDQANGHLGQLLAQAGPLTQAQTKAFIDQYRGSNPAYADEAQRGEEAAAFLAANRDGLLTATATAPEMAGQLTGLFGDMTKAGRGADVLPVITAIESRPDVHAAFAAQPGYNDELKERTLISAQAQLLKQSADVPDAAKRFLEIAEPLFRGKDGIEGVFDTYKTIASGNGTERLFTSAELGDSFRKLGPLGNGLAGASLMTSIALGDKSEEFTSKLYNYLTAAQLGTGLTVGVVDGIAGALRSAAPRSAAGLAAFSQFASRAVPWIGLTATGVNFYNDINDARQFPIFYGSIVGDVFSSVGGAMQVVPALEVPGVLIGGAGAILSMPFTIAGALQKQGAEDAGIRDEVRERLNNLPADIRPSAAAINAMASSDIEGTAAWGKTGMTPEQIQDLASRNATLLNNVSKNGSDISDLPAMEQRLGLSPTELHDMFATADNATPGGAGVVLRALELNSSTIRYAPTQTDMARQLREKASHVPYPEFSAALNAAAEYLQPAN